jgi:hypothetical protein
MCFCGLNIKEIHHAGTENTEVLQRGLLAATKMPSARKFKNVSRQGAKGAKKK